jgi:crotonobetainyl-CoA:carnitine CoA-transferase CaiB-like acyl-CoA transferase
MSEFRPLEGLTVLDLSRYLPGPLATKLLRGLGARVIKVEPPNGDALRYVPPMVDGIGASFRAVNTGCQSIVINLKDPAGVDLLRQMVTQVDILVESFRPGVLDKLGLGAEALLTLNPRLIYCAITGYGQTGSHRDQAGHDLNYLARAGVLGAFGPPNAPPLVPGVQIADIGGGSQPAVIQILAALLERGKTGKGRVLDISIADQVAVFGVLGMHEARGAGMLTGAAPCYRCYETADGEYVAFGALEPRFFAAFCEAAARPDLLPLQYDPSAVGIFEALFRSKTQEEWVAVLAGVDACVEPVVPAPPADSGSAPQLGADRDAILLDLGIDP